jgi:DNA-binding MarR family transcriptional regulator
VKSFNTYILAQERLNTSIIYSLFVRRCRALETDTIRMTGLELVEILGLDRGTVQRSIDRLLEIGTLQRVSGTKLQYKVKLPNENQSQ